MIFLNTNYLFIEILAGVITALLLGPLAVLLARKFGFIDMPSLQQHKKHLVPTPLAGGFIIALALVILIPIFQLWKMSSFMAIAVPTVVVFVFGLGDDHNKKLPSRVKLGGQVLAAVLFLLMGDRVSIIKPGFLGLERDVTVWINMAITLVWLVGITNAFNFIDSMDGLAVSIGATSLGFFVLAMATARQPQLAQLSALMFGVLMGLYFYNSPPARLFIGDSGAMTIGFLLAALSIFYTPRAFSQSSSWFVPIMLMGVPIFDTILVVFSRLRRGKPFYRANCDHTYHRMVKLGLDSNRAVLSMSLASLVLDCLAFVALNRPSLEANLIFAVVVLGGAGLVLFLDSHFVMAPAPEPAEPVEPAATPGLTG